MVECQKRDMNHCEYHEMTLSTRNMSFMPLAGWFFNG